MPCRRTTERHVDVYIHTDGAWERPPGRAAFHAHAGWSGQLMGNLSAVRQRWECCWRAPANVESCYKYDWLLHASKPHRRAAGWLGVLADSDVLFQCSAEELRVRLERLGYGTDPGAGPDRGPGPISSSDSKPNLDPNQARFERLGSPLVVSGERQVRTQPVARIPSTSSLSPEPRPRPHPACASPRAVVSDAAALPRPVRAGGSRAQRELAP